MLMVHTYQGVGHVLLRGGESSLQGGSCSSQVRPSSKGGVLIKIFKAWAYDFSLKSLNSKIEDGCFPQDHRITFSGSSEVSLHVRNTRGAKTPARRNCHGTIPHTTGEKLQYA